MSWDVESIRWTENRWARVPIQYLVVLRRHRTVVRLHEATTLNGRPGPSIASACSLKILGYELVRSLTRAAMSHRVDAKKRRTTSSQTGSMSIDWSQPWWKPWWSTSTRRSGVFGQCEMFCAGGGIRTHKSWGGRRFSRPLRLPVSPHPHKTWEGAEAPSHVGLLPDAALHPDPDLPHNEPVNRHLPARGHAGSLHSQACHNTLEPHWAPPVMNKLAALFDEVLNGVGVVDTRTRVQRLGRTGSPEEPRGATRGSSPQEV